MIGNYRTERFRNGFLLQAHRRASVGNFVEIPLGSSEYQQGSRPTEIPVGIFSAGQQRMRTSLLEQEERPLI